MFRFFLSAAAISVLLFSGLFLPTNVSARSRCPVKMPETLLSLYQNSDAIHIATFDRKTDGEVAEDTADYTSIGIKKHFSISSTLKGESRKFFVLEDSEYRYKNTGTTPAEAEESEEAEDLESSIELKPGDTLLLFLKNGDEEDAPTLTDYRDGTKKLSMEHIGVYEARIKELNSIFGAKKVDEAKIVEWLVRCAEDTVTRWEGTFELLGSFQNMEWVEQAAKQRKERIERGEPVEEEPSESETPNEEGEEEEGPRKNVDTSSFAKLLDVNQKQTLANILLDRPAPVSEDKDKAETEVRGDDELIELVKRFGDPRLVGFLLDQLRANSDEPYAVGQAMKRISEILDDKEIEIQVTDSGPQLPTFDIPGGQVGMLDRERKSQRRGPVNRRAMRFAPWRASPAAGPNPADLEQQLHRPPRQADTANFLDFSTCNRLMVRNYRKRFERSKREFSRRSCF